MRLFLGRETFFDIYEDKITIREKILRKSMEYEIEEVIEYYRHT